MNKVIGAFNASPTKANADKFIKHVRTHPMCECMMTPRESELYRLAQKVSAGTDTLAFSDWLCVNN